MALVISLTTIITQESHRVSFCNMLRVRLHKFLRTIPQRRDSVVILIQTQHKTILLLVIHHIPEWIKRDVAKELNTGFHAPVVLVVEHELMAEKESRFVAAHMSVAFRVAVNDFALFHVFADLGGFVLIDPFGIRPVFLWNEAVVGLSRHKSAGEPFEFIVEFFVVQEDPVIVVISVEAILDFSNRFGDFIEIAISCQRHECRIDSIARRCQRRRTGVGRGLGVGIQHTGLIVLGIALLCLWKDAGCVV